MATQDEIGSGDQSIEQTDVSMGGESARKKLFVEPEISVPVDVLEATTFFQTVDSGGTN